MTNAPNTPQGQQIATQAAAPRRDLASSLALMRPQIEGSLPPGISPDRFIRVAMNAIQNQPELSDPKVDRQSVFNACLRGAQLGLMPDKREGAIVVVNEKRKDDNGRDVWVKVAQFRDMVGGLRKLAADFGFDLIARSVYLNDAFEYAYGDEDRITHIPPKLGQERGELIGAYAIATRFSDGRKYRLVMDMVAINKRRAVAQTQAVWEKWTSEQSEKTVARALFKSLPLSENDEATERLNRLVNDEDEVEKTAREAETVTNTTQTAQAGAQAPRTRPRALDAVAAAASAQTAAGEHVDAEFTDVTSEPDPRTADQQAGGEPESHF